MWWPDEFLRARVNSASGSLDATCAVAGCCFCMNGACRQWQVQAWWLSLVAHQLTVRNQPESGGQPSVVDPKESVDGSESGRWMGSLRMPQRSLRYVGDVRSVRSCGSALELPSERATRSASSLFQPCSPVRMKGRPVQPARSGPSFLSCGTPCTASLKLPLTPVRLPQAKGVGHPRAGAGRDTRCCSAATDQRTGSALGPWSLGALGHRFV